MFEINTVKFRQMQIFVPKILKIGAKIAYMGIFRQQFSKSYRHVWNMHSNQKCFIGVFVGHNLTKTSIIFEISNFKILKLQSLVQN